jgi:hypothetical protein
MMSISKLWTRNLFTVSLALGLLSGCGGNAGPTGTVSGKVTLDGDAVAAGEIGFISAEGFSAVTEIGSGGSFTIVEKMPVDTYTVTVSPPAITEAPGEGGDTVEMAASDVPEGYWDEGTSDISKDITEGENTLTIELKAAGPAAQAGGAAAEDGETEE